MKMKISMENYFATTFCFLSNFEALAFYGENYYFSRIRGITMANRKCCELNPRPCDDSLFTLGLGSELP